MAQVADAEAPVDPRGCSLDQKVMTQWPDILTGGMMTWHCDQGRIVYIVIHIVAHVT